MIMGSNVASDGRKPIWPRKLRTMLLAGFILILTGIGMLVLAAVLDAGSSTDFGAVIFIGPIPIIVGAGFDPGWMTMIAIVLALSTLGMFLAMRRRSYT